MRNPAPAISTLASCGEAGSALTMAQIAVATLLLATAGLMTRSLAHLMDVQPGFHGPVDVLTATVDFVF